MREMEVLEMKKSNFAAMILGTVSGIFFALGICMALVAEWNLFNQGIVLGCAGLLLGFATLIVWRRMEHKARIRFSAKTVVAAMAGIIGTLGLGTGMCLSMVWDRIFAGIAAGLAGIVVLLCIVPVIKGIKE